MFLQISLPSLLSTPSLGIESYLNRRSLSTEYNFKSSRAPSNDERVYIELLSIVEHLFMYI